ncbi:hypothetical protein E1A91_D08G187600v1 [Gossypium mustelinum]|uniref:Uncharacterized protein n=1 Tax=Gossypium mustelinum TaxID=34275 RepID=A0A5D2TXG6_GOSMU|nr:hypothetical protein E1A91_D08G187600v1 [Gossypium mustelinum]
MLPTLHKQRDINFTYRLFVPLQDDCVRYHLT